MSGWPGMKPSSVPPPKKASAQALEAVRAELSEARPACQQIHASGARYDPGGMPIAHYAR